MQWLIDIVKKWVWIRGNLPPGFVNRGDPDVQDFNTGDFIKDGTWRDLDLSGVVPENAKGVSLALSLRATAIRKDFSLRTNGNVNTFNIANMRIAVADVVHYANKTVAVDADRKIEYKITDEDVNFVRLVIKGWWF